ncbi:LADA_0F02696g1_1 [Lachancea dasiensis]|uniref:LADA_0F02696g1_1 n=1 Tax=Lachancea dasiensis TaxID=1072105 RepID=A0A1G4JIG7_9SACH|nr:LADA_0F02696g1_1 [Lachancea dasiensis]
MLSLAARSCATYIPNKLILSSINTSNDLLMLTAMPKKHLGSPDHPSFELPSLPPWRTPRIKILHHTPSRAPSLLDDRDIFETPHEPKRQSFDDSAKKSRNPDIYDYTPFNDKGLLAAGKVDQLLRSESATHCLVFHKDKHKASDQPFRPDLDLWCCDSSEDEQEGGSISGSAESPASNNNKIPALPPVERPNVRRPHHNAISEKNALREFWDDSKMVDVLDRHQVNDIYTVLRQERELVSKCERLIQHDEHSPPPDETDLYRWLRRYCQNVWNKESWMSKPQDHREDMAAVAGRASHDGPDIT